MKLKALDQISISAVKADSLRPGEVFEVSDAYGSDLIKQHPTKFAPADAAPDPADEKAEPKPLNKAESAAPANKAEPKRRGK